MSRKRGLGPMSRQRRKREGLKSMPRQRKKNLNEPIKSFGYVYRYNGCI